jgi:hypothetical protein
VDIVTVVSDATLPAVGWTLTTEPPAGVCRMSATCELAEPGSQVETNWVPR